MTELIVALIMAFLTGITILAHKYPHAYEKLSLPSMIFNSGFTVVIAGFAWFAAVNNAYNTSLQFIPPDKQAAALKAIEGIKPHAHPGRPGICAFWFSLLPVPRRLMFFVRGFKYDV